MLGFTYHGNQAGPGPNGRAEWGAGASSSSPMKFILKSLALTLLAYLLPLAVLILGSVGLLIVGLSLRARLRDFTCPETSGSRFLSPLYGHQKLASFRKFRCFARAAANGWFTGLHTAPAPFSVQIR